VRIAGKVAATPDDDIWASTFTFRNWFTIDDGTGATTRYMNTAETPVQQTIPGIKVLFDPGGAGVAVGDMVEVTGVVGVDFTYSYAATGSTPAVTFNASGQRIIFCRTADDIYKYP
jgi:protein-disulfide isomerase